MTFKETFCAKKDINLASFCFFMIQEERKKKRRKTQQKVPACLFKSQADMLTFPPPTQKKEKNLCLSVNFQVYLPKYMKKKPTTSPYTFTWLNMYASVDQDNTPDCVRNVGKKNVKKKKDLSVTV